MLRHTVSVLGLLSLALFAPGCGERHDGSGDQPLVVFAAASLRDFATESAALFKQRHGGEVVFNFAGSNTLAQQILATPRADVFLSADRHWVDFLDQAGLTLPETRQPVLANSLVVIAHRDSKIAIETAGDLARNHYRFLALGDPQGVPAGRYARGTLERIPVDGQSLWAAVADRVAPALDVRAALALVETDPEILGIVYKTDALTSSRVRLLYPFPTLEDLPITYWAIRMAGGDRPDLGRLYLDHLTTPEAQEIAERHGFTPRLHPGDGMSSLGLSAPTPGIDRGLRQPGGP